MKADIKLKRLYSLSEAAIFFGRSVWSVREMIWQGKIPYIRDNKRLFLDLEDMTKWIERAKTTFGKN